MTEAKEFESDFQALVGEEDFAMFQEWLHSYQGMSSGHPEYHNAVKYWLSTYPIRNGWFDE